MPTSPLLSNIYLHKLDAFAETVLMPQYTRANSRADNPEYRKVESQVKAARRKGDRALSRSLGKRLRQLPSQDRNDPEYRRLRYVRYADDHLIGFAGPKAEAEEIKQRVDQHRAVTGGKHEAVAIRPGRVGGIEFQKAREQDGCDIGCSHGQPGMAGFRLLDRIHGKRPNGIGNSLVLLTRQRAAPLVAGAWG